ncbi:MAG: anthranilate synthase component I family protein [Pyrinomonadaceae bacterium]
MHEIDMTADELVSALLNLASSEPVCILDSCGVSHLGSHLLIAGMEPVETIEIMSDNAADSLKVLDDKLSGELACVLTLSYDLGLKMLGISSRSHRYEGPQEPDIFLNCFDVLIFHDYDLSKTWLDGNQDKFEAVHRKLEQNLLDIKFEISDAPSSVTSNFSKKEYLAAVELIKERIRCGDTYQTNLTQQLVAKLPPDITPEIVFARLRRNHPAPFSAFIKRFDSTIVSASPERFFQVGGKGGNTTDGACAGIQTISTSPVKGTRSRGETVSEDNTLRQELLTSRKDRAENTMIVDLLRNDLGRICEYGSVLVEKLCDLEEHPTLFHLVSTVSGDLRPDTKSSDILKAVFPCGSITGAPKISTMQIIDEIETTNRGLSMGAIGYYVPSSKFDVQSSKLELSVAIRTMVIREQVATFNVGGGVVIDSDPESEYDETLLKAKALLAAIGTSF